MSSLVAKLEQLSINHVKLNENVTSNPASSKPYVPYVGNGAALQRNNFVCFYCRDDGHKKYECPKFLRDQNQASSTPATGSKAVPIGKGGQEAQLLEAVVTKAAIVTNEILANGVKTRATSEFGKIWVKFKRWKIWAKLMGTESGISVAEWLSLDREAAAEMIDGIRYLRESKVKKKVSSGVGISGGVGVSGGVGAGAVVGDKNYPFGPNISFNNAMDVGVHEVTNASEGVDNTVFVNEVGSEGSSSGSDLEEESDYDSSSFSGEVSDLEFNELKSV
ncbi:hypothetical protein INT47_007399 [Mucor saturninus]|uniref:CCHC-type domain-containing protein n=1 Tax=Mucor saturninus TaxID=64648 RepID=A0A8H7UPD7_9FUNG|nr:hypothetical protein INT47_007399 [Mucor saturninus]